MSPEVMYRGTGTTPSGGEDRSRASSPSSHQCDKVEVLSSVALIFWEVYAKYVHSTKPTVSVVEGQRSLKVD